MEEAYCMLLMTSITIGTVLGQGNLNRFECRFIMSREGKVARASLLPLTDVLDSSPCQLVG